MDSAIELASQLIIQVVSWPLVVLLAIVTVRRRRTDPWLWIPASGTALLLASTAASFALPQDNIAGAIWFAVFPLLLATYPDGRFVPRITLLPVLGWFVLTGLYVATNAGIADQWWWAPAAFSTALLVIPQIYRYRRRATTKERESARWAIFATLLCFALFVIITIAEGGTVAEHGPLSVAAANIAGAVIPVGFAIGLVRPRIIHVDSALRWFVVAALTTAVLAPAFWATLTLAGFAGADATAAAWSAVIPVAALAVPVARLSTRLADRMLFGARPDAATAVVSLGDRLSGQADPDEVTATIARVIAEALALDTVELTAHGLATVLVGDSPSGEPIPLTYQGEVIGSLRVSPRRGESDLTARDVEVLKQLAVHAAPALHGARAVSQLIEARSRTVLAREEERKRLRRDLHDDLAPTLAGMGMSAAAISELARSGDPEASAVADELLADIQAAIGQTRELAYGLRPPILDDQGLVAAVRDRLRIGSAERPRVTISAPEVRLELPAAVELAALRIVQEAVSNVRRHASASACVVTIARTAGSLTIDVSDDGTGLPKAHRLGLGLSSIRERAEELGGAARIEARAMGGTTVAVRLPVASGPEDAA